MPSAGYASPMNSWSTPAMIRSSVLLPAPLRPMTPILAPGRNDSHSPRRISRFGGTIFFRPIIVNTYCWAMGSSQVRVGRVAATG